MGHWGVAASAIYDEGVAWVSDFECAATSFEGDEDSRNEDHVEPAVSVRVYAADVRSLVLVSLRNYYVSEELLRLTIVAHVLNVMDLCRRRRRSDLRRVMFRFWLCGSVRLRLGSRLSLM